MKIIGTILLLAASFSVQSQIAMNGVKIGDAETSLAKIRLETVAQETSMAKFRTLNGNDLSFTSENGKIIFMENDWLQDPKGTKPLFSDFQFGKTTLKDIRAKLGNNGFTYRERAAFTTETDLIEFNCFEFDSPGNEVLVFITKIPLTADVTEENVASLLKLDAIIIADKKYLDANWGEEKAFDPNYKKIRL